MIYSCCCAPTHLAQRLCLVEVGGIEVFAEVRYPAQHSTSIVAHHSERSLEARLWHRQPRNIGARAEHGTFQGAIVSVVGGNRVKIAHVGATEGDASH
jgi:hypothetical protein